MSLAMAPLATILIGALLVALIIADSGRRAGVFGYAPRTKRPRPSRAERRRASRRQRRRWISLGLTGAGLVVLVVVAVQAFAVAGAVQKVQLAAAQVAQARDTLGSEPDGWTPEKVNSAGAVQREAAATVNAAAADLKSNLLVRAAGAVPGLRASAHTLTDLADGTVAGTSAFGDYIAITQAVGDTRTSSQPAGARLLTLLGSAGPHATNAVRTLSPAISALERDQAAHPLPPLASRLQTGLDTLRPLRDTANLVAVAATFGPTALGGSHPASYLVLLPNPTELRPSGGFSGAVGAVTLTGGAPSALNVRNQDDYNPLIKQRQPVPTALARYLKFYKNGLELGDAGWDPDFPTTARLSEQIYQSAGGAPVDGTISVDPYAVSALLALTGPVDVGTYGSFDSTNFLPKLNAIVNTASNPAVGKAALPPISRAVLDKVLNQPASSWPRMLAIFRDQAEQRHLQAYFHDPALAAAAASAHFDGALVTPGTDYLMLADANVGATKGDAYVHKSMQVLTEVHPDLGIARHQVTVTYDMPLSTGPTDSLLNPGDGSYRDYIRFVLPEEALVASLVTTSGGKSVPAAVDSITLAHSHQLVGAFIRVPRGTQATVSLAYEVPLNGSSYSLYVQKQAGVEEMPVTETTSFPGGVSRRLDAMTADLRLAAG